MCGCAIVPRFVVCGCEQDIFINASLAADTQVKQFVKDLGDTLSCPAIRAVVIDFKEGICCKPL
jgi:hypothetical protein